MEKAEYSKEELILLIKKIRFRAWYDIQQFRDASYSTESQKEVANWALERFAFIQLMCESVIEPDDLIEYPNLQSEVKMNRAIFLDIDGILTASDDDIAVLPGVEAALKYYENQTPKWVMVGISNTGGMGVENAIVQMQYTLRLLPQLKAVYFCPDEKGLVCWRVTHTDSVKLFDGSGEVEIPPELRHSSPGVGMVYQATTDFRIDLTQSWLVGENSECAGNAGLNFIDSQTWRNRFLPGMYEIKPATIEQVQFLESRSFSNDKN